MNALIIYSHFSLLSLSYHGLRPRGKTETLSPVMNLRGAEQWL
jgi:hypothetical protein